jgi:16S rRNA (cytosine967-C5)-methyltransferase
LRLGLAQALYYSERIPSYAAVNESVQLARKHRQRYAAPMINAVLRRALREKDRLPWPDSAARSLEYAAIRQSHPEWMVARWRGRWGAGETDRLCAANNAVPPFTVRVNTLKITRDALRERLAEEGVPAEHCVFSPDGLVLGERPEMERLESFASGLFIVQDEASQLISRVLGPRPGEKILDLCSGSGIKASHIAQLSGGTARVTAVDLSPEQLKRAAGNFSRLGIENIEILRADITALKDMQADRVLIDVPCSGLGVIRRKPDIKWNRVPEDITQRYPPLQRELLLSAAERVKPDGVLVYSTCSIEPEEDEEVIASFLKEKPLFAVERIEPPAIPAGFITPEGFFRSFPRCHNTDGFFAARIRRRS